MTNEPAGSTATTTTARSADDVRLARVHLRLGQLTLARAELEDLARRDQLDATTLAVLAEARWRTGDAAGAAEAADAHLAAGGSDDVALCIAAEAAALDGRQDDARELMDRLPSADAATLDALFAGMPRRASWPAGPVARADLDDLRRPGDRDRGGARRPGGVRGADSQTQLFRRAELEAEAEAAAARPESGPSPSPPPTPHSPRRRKAQLDPTVELARAREEIDVHTDRALLRLALVLRHDPTRAPAVLDVLHLRREPRAALLRGDAQRLLGRHLEAEAAYDAAAESLEAS
jgi:tetratricopeptide (TPR) repeat protein